MSSAEERTEGEFGDAHEVYAAYVRDRQEGKGVDFEGLCTEHPEFEGELRKLDSLAELVRVAATSRSFHQSIRERFGDVDEVTISLPTEFSHFPGLSEETEVTPSFAQHGGRYESEGELARGGMGVIYKVKDRDLSRTIAMKVMLAPQKRDGEPSEKADSQSLVRFLEEAHVTAQLDHPGIVPVYELGFDARGQVYFTMKLVKGRALGEIWEHARGERNGWNLPRAVGVLVKACQAVALAHTRGVIHRDLKPSNIMVGRFGEVYVMDWGLARVTGRKDLHDIRLRPDSPMTFTSIQSDRDKAAESGAESPLITMDGSVVGTPAYMPPEQAEGRVEEVDKTSDVYSLGAILYTLLAGQIPYVPLGARISPHTILAKVQEAPPKRVHELDPRAPPELTAICEKAMARDREDRYESSLEMAEDLQAYLDHRVVKAYRTGAVAEFTSWVVRNKSTAVAGAVAAFLLVLAAVVASVGYVKTKEALHREAVQREETTRNLYHSLVREARAIRLARNAGYRVQAWKRLKQAMGLDTPEKNFEELRQEATACMGDFVGLEPKVWEGFSPRNIRSTALHPQTPQLAVGWNDGAVSLRNLETGEETDRLKSHDSAVTAITFGPRGDFLISGDMNGSIKIWKFSAVAQWKPVRTITIGNRIRSLAVSPNGEHLAVHARRSTEVLMWNLSKGAWEENFQAPGSVRCVTLSPDGKLLAAGSQDPAGEQRITIWSMEERTIPHQTVPTNLGFLHSLSFSHDGQFLACGGEEGVAIFEATNYRRWSLIRGDIPYSVAFSPDQQLLAFSSMQLELVRLWNVAANREIVELRDRGSRSSSRNLFFSTDGRALVSSTYRSVRRWNLAGTDEKLVLSGHGGGIPGVAFSPDSLLVASASKDRTLKIWDPTTGELLTTLTGFSGPVQALAFYPDGRMLAAGDWSGNVKIWGGPAWKELAVVNHDLGVQIWSVAFSPDGNYFAASSDLGISIWRLGPDKGKDEPQTQPRFLKSSRVTLQGARSICFSPDSKILAWITTNDSAVQAWDLVNDRALPLPPTRTLYNIHNLAFFPDSRSVVFVNAKRAAEVWNVLSGQRAPSFGGKTSAATDGMALGSHIALSPDGAWLATGNPGRNVSVWDTQRKMRICSLPEGTATVWCLAWSPDRQRLAVGFSDGSLVIWNFPEMRSQLGELGLDW